MERNNFFEKSLPLHYAVMAGNEEAVKIILNIMRSMQGKPDPQKKNKKKDAQTIAF